MPLLLIKDKIEAVEGRSLAFDLRDVLRSLGPEALDWAWTVAPVEANGEALEAVGEGWMDLQALERSSERVAGSQLARIAERIEQIVWGEFRAYRRGQTSAEPFVRIIAFDSSFFEVWCDDETVVGRVRAAFKDTELTPHPPP